MLRVSIIVARRHHNVAIGRRSAGASWGFDDADGGGSGVEFLERAQLDLLWRRWRRAALGNCARVRLGLGLRALVGRRHALLELTHLALALLLALPGCLHLGSYLPHTRLRHLVRPLDGFALGALELHRALLCGHLVLERLDLTPCILELRPHLAAVALARGRVRESAFELHGATIGRGE